MRLRIAYLSKDFSSNGGVGTYLLKLCSALEAAGHEVIVIHADPGVSLSPSIGFHQFYVEGFDQFAPQYNERTSASRVIEILEGFKPNIVHIQGNNNFLLETGVRLRFPAIKTLHVYDFCPSGNKFHHGLQKVCNHPTGPLCLPRMGYKRCLLSKRPSVIWWHYRRCVEANRNNAPYSRLIVASAYVKLQAVASGYPASQIEVLPYFTNLPMLRGFGGGGTTGRREPSDGMILFVGRVVREKGLHHLLSALAMVHIPWQLVVAGDGPDLDRVKKLARRLGLQKQVVFAGWAQREHLAELYQDATVVVMPSVWPEPFGIVGIEAMSFGRAVIAFNVGGVPEWLQECATGFLVKPYDVKEMAEKINYLLKHPDVAHEMGMRGRKRVEQEFTKENHIARLLEIYEEVCSERTQLKQS